jgi:hypothetical protein
VCLAAQRIALSCAPFALESFGIARAQHAQEGSVLIDAANKQVCSWLSRRSLYESVFESYIFSRRGKLIGYRACETPVPVTRRRAFAPALA